MSFCHACKVVYWAGESCDMCIAHATIARQARTIRRLRALADGYREHAKAWRYYTRGLVNGARTWMLKDKEAGMQEERARIVAALGASVWTGSLYPPEVHAVVQSIRDAIERGEL